MATYQREIFEVHLAYVNDAGFHASDPNVIIQITRSSSTARPTMETLRKPGGLLTANSALLKAGCLPVIIRSPMRISSGCLTVSRSRSACSVNWPTLKCPIPIPNPKLLKRLNRRLSLSKAVRVNESAFRCKAEYDGS